MKQQQQSTTARQLISMTPITLGLDDAAVAVGVTRRTMEREIRAGRLATLKVRGRRLVAVTELQRYIESAQR